MNLNTDEAHNLTQATRTLHVAAASMLGAGTGQGTPLTILGALHNALDNARATVQTLDKVARDYKFRVVTPNER